MNHGMNRAPTMVTLLVVLAMAFGACTPTPIATSAPTKSAATVAPTVALAPTSTRLPTATAIPTSTVTLPPTADPSTSLGSTQVSVRASNRYLDVPYENWDGGVGFRCAR